MRIGLMNGFSWGLGLWMFFLACVFSPEESHISFFSNSLIELICNGRACHVLRLNVTSPASAGHMANPGSSTGAAKRGQCLAGPSAAGWYEQGWDGHTLWDRLDGQLPAGLFFPCLDGRNSTAWIFLACSLHEFVFKDYFLKTFSVICLKCAVSVGCTCSQGYHPRVNTERAQSQQRECSFHGKCRQVSLCYRMPGSVCLLHSLLWDVAMSTQPPLAERAPVSEQGDCLAGWAP